MTSARQNITWTSLLSFIGRILALMRRWVLAVILAWVGLTIFTLLSGCKKSNGVPLAGPYVTLDYYDLPNLKGDTVIKVTVVNGVVGKNPAILFNTIPAKLLSVSKTDSSMIFRTPLNLPRGTATLTYTSSTQNITSSFTVDSIVGFYQASQQSIAPLLAGACPEGAGVDAMSLIFRSDNTFRLSIHSALTPSYPQDSLVLNGLYGVSTPADTALSTVTLSFTNARNRVVNQQYGFMQFKFVSQQLYLELVPSIPAQLAALASCIPYSKGASSRACDSSLAFPRSVSLGLGYTTRTTPCQTKYGAGNLANVSIFTKLR